MNTTKKVLKKAISILNSPLALISRSFHIHLTEDQLQKLKENNNTIYHFVKTPDPLDAIKTSQYLKYSTDLKKRLQYWGKGGIFCFSELPTLKDYSRNIKDYHTELFEPDSIQYGIEITLTDDELSNLKFRPFHDESLKHEGMFVPRKHMKVIEVVPDLKRDNLGNPIINPETQRPEIILRKRTREELANSPGRYIPRQDYLDEVQKQRIESGLFTKKGKMTRGAKLKSALLLNLYESEIYAQNLRKNFSSLIKYFIESIKSNFSRKLLGENTKEKLDRKLNQGFGNKNPYLDPDFSQNIAYLKTKGLSQISLREILTEFNFSEEVDLLKRKIDTYERKSYFQKSIPHHGKSHFERVGFWATFIAKQQGLIKDKRLLDIFITSSLLHDIGKVTAVDLPFFSHEKIGAKKIANMNLKASDGTPYSIEEVRIIQALIECHNGKQENIPNILTKYNIDKSQTDLIHKLALVLRDADALDRCRLDSTLTHKVNLNPKYLHFKSSKTCIEASYKLEEISNEMDTFSDILSYGVKPTNDFKKELREKASSNSHQIPSHSPQIQVTHSSIKSSSDTLSR